MHEDGIFNTKKLIFRSLCLLFVACNVHPSYRRTSNPVHSLIPENFKIAEPLYCGDAIWVDISSLATMERSRTFFDIIPDSDPLSEELRIKSINALI